MEISEYKRGWYRKGKSLRYLLALRKEGSHMFLLYQTKTEKLKNSRQVTGLNIEVDTWFPEAEYLGLELPIS